MGQSISNGVYIHTDKEKMTYRSSADKYDTDISVNDIRLENLMRKSKKNLLLKYSKDTWTVVYEY